MTMIKKFRDCHLGNEGNIYVVRLTTVLPKVTFSPIVTIGIMNTIIVIETF